MAMAMQKRALVGDFQPGFMLKLAHKDCRLALQMYESLGVSATAGRAALASLDEGRSKGMDLLDVGALLKLREEEASVSVRLAPS
jgi:4-hydroxybutyrate dehydrogenase/sulfolactaldehyde 3-reductase